MIFYKLKGFAEASPFSFSAVVGVITNNKTYCWSKDQQWRNTPDDDDDGN